MPPPFLWLALALKLLLVGLSRIMQRIQREHRPRAQFRVGRELPSFAKIGLD